MTITAVIPTPDNNGLSMDSDGHISVPLSYTIQSNLADESPLTVFLAVPKLYPFADVLAFILQLDSVEVTRKPDSKFHWSASVVYSTRTPDPDKSGPGKSGNDNPLDQPAEVSWSSGTTTEIVEKDVDDKAILNAAGEPFDPPVEVQRPQPELTVNRNESSFSGADAMDYVFTVNDGVFAGGEPGTVLCTAIDATEAYSNGVAYFKVTYKFLYRKQGWQKSLLNQSLMHKDGDDWVRILDDQGQPVPDPVPIDSIGQVIQRDDLPDSAEFLDFDVYEKKDFGVFNLPV